MIHTLCWNGGGVMKVFKKLRQVVFPQQKDRVVMGARYEKQQVPPTTAIEEHTEDRKRDVEKYFRPSCDSVLNDRLTEDYFFQPYYKKSYKEITLPPSLMDTPEHTIIHYFSILREAENLTSKQMGGCGTV